MNILFFTGCLEKKLNANSKIAYELAKTLADSGHNTVICGMSDSEDLCEAGADHVMRIYYRGNDPVTRSQTKFKCHMAGSAAPDPQKRAQFIRRQPFDAALIAYSYTRFYKKRILIRQAAKKIEALHKQYSFDAVVGFHMPFWAVESVMSANVHGCKKYIYQLDPWGLHELHIVSDPHSRWRIARETACFQKADGIFTTPVLYQQYAQHPAYHKFLFKITPVEFPNIKAREAVCPSPISFGEDCTHILYTGLLDDQYRSPLAFLQLIEKLVCTGSKIKVHFLGTILDSRSLAQYIERYPDVFIPHGTVPFDQAFAAMNGCDFLLNISNAITNMVPSKIFDYVSLGKPIINIQKIKNCPAAPYMSRYPLCFTIREYAPADDTAAERLEAFLKAHKGERLPFEAVKTIYQTSTPEFVAKQFLGAIDR